MKPNFHKLKEIIERDITIKEGTIYVFYELYSDNLPRILYPSNDLCINSLAHEYGHYISARLGYRNKYNLQPLADKLFQKKHLSFKEKILIFNEEIRAWKFARILLKNHYMFKPSFYRVSFHCLFLYFKYFFL